MSNVVRMKFYTLMNEEPDPEIVAGVLRKEAPDVSISKIVSDEVRMLVEIVFKEKVGNPVKNRVRALFLKEEYRHGNGDKKNPKNGGHRIECRSRRSKKSVCFCRH